MIDDTEMGRTGVQAYLVAQVELHGGMAEHIRVAARRGAPDFLVTWRTGHYSRLDLVECKRPKGGRLSGPQKRDHIRRAKYGCHVRVLWTKKAVDLYILSRPLA